MTTSELLEAKIQSRIADFLALKKPLLDLTQNLIPSINSKAKSLYQNQAILEKELQDNLKKIETMKTSGLDFGTVAQIGTFYAMMEKHIGDSHKFMDLAKQNTVQETGITDPRDAVPFIKWVGLAGLVGMVALGLRRR